MFSTVSFRHSLFAGTAALCSLWLLWSLSVPQNAIAQFKSSYAKSSTQNLQNTRPGMPRYGGGGGGGTQSVAPGGIYPEFKSNFGVIRWLNEQMPLKVYVSPGLCLDGIIDQMGAPVTNVDNRAHWPDVVADVLGNQAQFKSLGIAKGYIPQHSQAAVQGINSWKPFEKEGLISYTLVNDPTEADIHVFWTDHFTDKLGMGLFQNDIRGYTAKRSFPIAAIREGKQVPFRPVVVLLRTTDSAGNPMSLERMKASAAHEFGHALGIEGHSTNSNDLMSVYYGRGVVSQGDAATIRYLYHLQPELVP
ncbi:MAG TPA: matrixin family metalloprotease [Oculatellaceae cyanobacterium]